MIQNGLAIIEVLYTVDLEEIWNKEMLMLQDLPLTLLCLQSNLSRTVIKVTEKLTVRGRWPLRVIATCEFLSTNNIKKEFAP